jgi:hypothetical protein
MLAPNRSRTDLEDIVSAIAEENQRSPISVLQSPQNIGSRRYCCYDRRKTLDIAVIVLAIAAKY